MATSSDIKINLPVLTATKAYDRYKTELSLWKTITTVPAKKLGPVVALSLPDDHESRIKDKVFEQMTIEELSSDTGYDDLIKLMDSILLKDSLSEAFEKYNDFEKFSRTTETVYEFIEEFDLKYKRLTKFKIKIPSEILAFKLLIHVNITPEEQMLVKSGIDYSLKDTMYEQTKTSLKKFKTECSGGAVPNSFNIKTESVNVTYPRGGSRSLQHRGSFQRGRGSYGDSGAQRAFGTGYGKFRQNSARQKNIRFAGNSDTYKGNQNRYNSRQSNPISPDGNIMRCIVCDSKLHLIRDCPHSYENTNSAFQVSEDAFDEEAFCLYTGKNLNEMFVLSTEAKNCAVLDSACSSTVCGREWLNDYLSSLDENQLKNVQKSASQKTFKFGGGNKLPSNGQYVLPAVMAGKRVTIKTDVVDSDIPLLLSKNAMKKACMKLDLESDTAEIMGTKIHLNCTTSGHYCIPIGDEKDVFNVDLENASVQQREKILQKLHCQFGHASSQKLINLLKDAKVWQHEFKDSLDDIIKHCEICQQFSKTKPRSIVSFPLAKAFNEVVSLDLKHWENGFILHIIDVWSRYSMSVFISRKLPQLVIDNLMKRWIAVFGTMKAIMSDNGGEFTADVIKEVASMLGVRLLTTAGNAPHQNGLNERIHAVVDLILHKLKAQYPKLELDVLLGWANMAKNCLHMNHGYSSHQLVFGQNPYLPNILTDEPPALEDNTMSQIFARHLSCLHSSRQQFIQSESNERIRRALRHKIRISNETYEKGDEIFYKKDGNSRWLGPAKVLAQDGKLVFVRHGNQLMRIAPNRLIKRYQGQIESDENVVDEHNKVVSNDESNQLPNANIEEESESNNTESKENEQTNKAGTECPLIDCEESDTLEDQQSNGTENLSNTGNNSTEQVVRRSLRLLNAENNWEVYSVHVPKCLQSEPKCVAAKHEELLKLKDFNVYEEVVNKGQPCISTRWVCTRKGEDIKARLVARGFQETEHVRADSPTIGKSIARITLSIAASKGWVVKTTDVKSAFLQSDEIDREVFLKPPEEAECPDKLWRLRKSLYGLNDAARQFFLSLTSELKRLGCKQSTLDHTLHFLTGSKNTLCGIILTHVDDFLHCGDNYFEQIIMRPLVQRFLAGRCSVSKFKYIGLQIMQMDNHEIFLDQSDYSNSIEEPAFVKYRNNDDDLSTEEYSTFRALVGGMNWLVCGSRPDLAFDVLEHSSKFKKATKNDLSLCLKSVRKCKKDTVINRFPSLATNQPMRIILFSDASYANLPDGVSSTLGYIIFLVDCNNKCSAISWKSNKIKRICRSTLAAEAMALVEGLEECIYLREVLEEIGGFLLSILALVDSKSLCDAIYSTKLVDDKRLRIDIAALQQLCGQKKIEEIKWCTSEKQLANALTKRGASATQLLEVLRLGSLSPYLN